MRLHNSAARHRCYDREIFIVVLPTALSAPPVESSDVIYDPGIGAGYLAVFLLEMALTVIFALLLAILYPVACMSIGQRFKNRILASVLIYIGVQWALQFIFSFASFFLGFYFFGYDSPFNPGANPGASMVTGGAVALLISVAACAVCYFISRHMLTKKLNLM